jgi:hypothetical protein
VPTLVATPGAPDANSYVTVEAADAFLAAELGAATWPASSTGADRDTKERALITATRQLDRLAGRFIGALTWQGQALAWPRSVPAIDERTVDPTTIPPRVQRACIRLALRLLQAPDVLAPDDEREVVRKKIGPLETEYAPGARRSGWARFPDVLAELGDLLDGGTGLTVARA